MNERLKKLRKELDLTQQKFGERIGVKGNTIAQYEIGRNEPIDAVISLICREFNVSEEWLRTGEGDMFIKLTRDEEIAEWVGHILTDESAKFQRRFINALSKMNQAGWDALEKVLNDLCTEDDEDDI